MNINKKITIITVALLAILAASCNDSKSYSELLTEEEKAVNWYLAQNEVVTEIPEDSVFKTGPEAPYYKMTLDGSVYMRVLETGDLKNKPKFGDRVYFSFMRQSIKDLYKGYDPAWQGNDEDMSTGLGSTSFFLGNTVLPSTTQYGTGIQMPMDYLGYYSQVEIIIKSTKGFETDITQCEAYVYKIRYFPAIY